MISVDMRGVELDEAEVKPPKLSAYMCVGECYQLFISPTVVQVGCESHSPEDWRNMTKEDIAEMDGRKALKFYPRLLDFFLEDQGRPEWVSE